MNKTLALPLSRDTVPALVCAGICVALMRSGFLTFFFLLPLGFCHTAFGAATAWLCFVFAALGNAVLSTGVSLYYGTGLAGAVWDTLYFGTLALGFAWIMAGNPRIMPVNFRIRTVYRFIAASVAGALAFLGMLFTMGREEGFQSFLRSHIEAVSAAYIASPGADAAPQSFLESGLTPDKIIEAFSMIALRGGSLFFAFFLFFFSRQGSFLLAKLFRRQRNGGGGSMDSTAGDLTGFFVPRRTIWVLTLCLPAIVAFRIISLEMIEVAAWNVLVICVIMFLAQGGGIVLFTLARRPMPPMMRLIFGICFVMLVFSPGLNLLALGALILLGIAENWLPLRKVAVSNEQ